MSGRKLSSWIEGFIEYSETLQIPVIYRRWAAISILSGALERRVWVRTLGNRFFANLYVILVGPPSSGKSLAIGEVYKMWGVLRNKEKPESSLHVAPTSVTTAALIDSLNHAKRTLVFQHPVPSVVTYNSLQIAISELSDFLPEGKYDSGFVSALINFWDSQDHIPFEEQRRGRGKGDKNGNIVIEHPQLSMIAATTPSYLTGVMPPGAWDQGFISRTVLVYSGQDLKPKYFAEITRKEEIFTQLRDDLLEIFRLYGEILFSPDAMLGFQAWTEAPDEPPGHRNLLHYGRRRASILEKLCMIATVSRGSDMRVELADVETARQWLLEAEAQMGEIFKAFGSGGDAAAMENCHFFMLANYAKTSAPIGEELIIRFLSSVVPGYNVMKVIELMEKSRMIECVGNNGGMKMYKPLLRKRGEI